MASADLPPPALIEDPDGLQSLIARMAGAPRVALDTESNSLHAYQEQVCLMQFSLPEGDFVLDPLAVRDLGALGAVLADPGIEKIFHAAEYDLICLQRDFGFQLTNLFDTMVAARTLGWKKLGLANILEERFGVTLNKRFQRADWAKRPLTPEHLAYARLDTHYLIALRDELVAELAAAECWEEAREEFERVSVARNGEAAPGGSDPHGFWRITGARELHPPQLAVLRELFHYRDHMARKLNRPVFKVMGDGTLLSVAKALPASRRALKEVPGMTEGQMRRHERGLLEAVRKGKSAPPPRFPRAERIADDVLARYEALRTWRKGRATKRGVESDVIVPREVLWELARRAPSTLDDLAQVPGLMPYRRAMYGEEILAVLIPPLENGD